MQKTTSNVHELASAASSSACKATQAAAKAVASAQSVVECRYPVLTTTLTTTALEFAQKAVKSCKSAYEYAQVASTSSKTAERALVRSMRDSTTLEAEEAVVNSETKYVELMADLAKLHADVAELLAEVVDNVAADVAAMVKEFVAVRLKRGIYRDGGSDNDTECAICIVCFESGVETASMFCGHVFHEMVGKGE